MSLRGRRILLGVCGSISAYKVVQVARDLTVGEADVTVMMTEDATQFVTPLTFQALTGKPVLTNMWEGWMGDAEAHITLGRNADVMLIAPATAQTIARLALGLSDDLIGLTALAAPCPILIAPAMNHRMWEHPTTQANVATLVARGVTLVPPETGRLASGEEGTGRLPEPASITGAVRWRLGREGGLRGKKVVVTAGGTREPLDPVRYIGNRSSGRMGYALAQAALDEGADVTLISSNVALPTPWGAELVQAPTAGDMLTATQSACEDAHALIMAAAVADYRPLSASDSKIKKTGDGLTVRLVENEDVIAGIQHPGLIKVGFAAETENLEANALAKLRRKGQHLQIVNDAARTIGSEETQATLLYPNGSQRRLARLPKEEAAREIIAAIRDLAIG